MTLNGLLVSEAMSVVPWKKSTRATVPSASLALALIVIEAGAAYVAPSAGAVSDTVGGWFAPAMTVTLRAPEVVSAPASSTARAVSE
ncbi:hypothetical protein D3C83_10190 [compost metagenome]